MSPSVSVDISLVANYPRYELRREGLEIFKKAGALRGAVLEEGEFRPSEIGVDMAGDPDPDALWREPETGSILLRPSSLRSDFKSSDEWAGTWLRLADLHHAEGGLEEVIVEVPPYNSYINTSRIDLFTPVDGISAPFPYTGFDIGDTLVWAASTKTPFAANEGFSFLIRPYGTPFSRFPILAAVAFGDMWTLTIATGKAALWLKVGGAWTLKRQFDFAFNPEQATPVEVNVIPWGIDFISVMISQGSSGPRQNSNSSGTSVAGSFLVQTRQFGFTPEWDASRKQYIKTKAAPIAIALPNRSQSVFSLARIRYKAAGLRLAPEPLGEPKPETTPVARPIGFFGQNSGGAIAGAFADSGFSAGGASITNRNGAAWTPATDTSVVATTWLRPSADGLYSPEVWAFEWVVEPQTYLSEDATIDLSSRWRRLSWIMTGESRPTAMTLLFDRSDDWSTMLNLYGSLKLEIDEEILWEGTFRQMRPVIEGAAEFRDGGELGPQARRLPVISDDALADDLWTDLESTPAQNPSSFSRQTVGSIIEKCFKRIGASTGEIEVQAELYDIEVDGFDAGSDDWKLPNDEATIAHVIRRLNENYGFQGRGEIRARRWLGKWKAWITRVWNPEEAVDGYFFVDQRCLPSGVATDAERWSAEIPWLKVRSGFEPWVTRPEFNALVCHAATRTGDGGDGLCCYIAHDPAALSPSHPNHMPRISTRMITPGEASMASTMNGLARLARRIHEREGTVQRGLDFEGEWQPFCQPDQIWAVLAIAPADDGDIAAGDIVSLGAYRIDIIQAEIYAADRGDDPPSDVFTGGKSIASRRHTWSGQYSLNFLGATDLEWAPMFTVMDFG